MSHWHEGPDEPELVDTFDPLCIERSTPVDDHEAAEIEALCLAATPGPLVVDDQVDGEGAVVFALPDGRMIVSLTATLQHTEDKSVADANARLICKARYSLLRLLRDRQRWNEQRESLLQRIRALETALGLGPTTDQEAEPAGAARRVRRPR